MAPEDGGAPPSRKVRSACRRCRTKRVKWLERQVKALSPDFDFSQGPQVNMDFLESFGTAQDNPQPETVLTGPISTAEYLVRGSNQDEPVANKRSHSIMESEAGSPLSAKARSVAIDLGMLSLQSDSRQRHYLGSSSGLLFTKLLGLDSEPSPAQASFQARPLAPRRIPDGIYRSLYDQLQKVISDQKSE
ncbi:hypothetical protein N7462_002041 [Penicillium macrosclerotiorum]|uniref:uncharacterized protein n=1 Tax=Penicillium macrosclerotiorum TaxID=303699 RepID=UPI002547189F|nr:uncharacterized protein N7462_002041 [Penicillium macrosclerotiorum]KAJ5692618.1 hypothetical protein N7462_002041 [Penicillium macrosclerotiorum]